MNIQKLQILIEIDFNLSSKTHFNQAEIIVLLKYLTNIFKSNELIVPFQKIKFYFLQFNMCDSHFNTTQKNKIKHVRNTKCQSIIFAFFFSSFDIFQFFNKNKLFFLRKSFEILKRNRNFN